MIYPLTLESPLWMDYKEKSSSLLVFLTIPYLTLFLMLGYSFDFPSILTSRGNFVRPSFFVGGLSLLYFSGLWLILVELLAVNLFCVSLILLFLPSGSSLKSKISSFFRYKPDWILPRSSIEYFFGRVLGISVYTLSFKSLLLLTNCFKYLL